MESDINEIRNLIISFLQKGPNFVVDISENIGKDTMQTSAILDYFVGNGDISKTERHFGTSPVYFLEKDRDAALAKLSEGLNSNEKAVINKVKQAGVVNLEDLSPMERYVIQGLGDFIKKISATDRETAKKVDYAYYYKLSLDDIRASINPTAKAANSKQPKTVQKSRAKKPENGITIAPMLQENGFLNPETIDKDVYLCEYGPHAIKVVVGVIEKSPVSKKDLARIAGYSSAYKTIAFALTRTDKVPGKRQYGNSMNIIKVR